MTTSWNSAQFGLNDRAWKLVEELRGREAELRITSSTLPLGGQIYDFGISTPGSLEAGLILAEICLSDLATVNILPGQLNGQGWPILQVISDWPVHACLYSQYAGWQVSVGKYFAMGSGPMRAASGREEIFKQHQYRENTPHVVGVLEGRKLPTDEVVQAIAEKTGVPGRSIALLIAPTASLAGTVQVVSRFVETALHKLFELGFDLTRIVSAQGFAPLAPVAKDDLTGIGRTNDAILYGGQVTLWVRGDDESLFEIGPRVPAVSSECYGEPFLKIFEAAGRDFYKIDPHLFSPAEITFHNLDTGRIHRFGQVDHTVLVRSFF